MEGNYFGNKCVIIARVSTVPQDLQAQIEHLKRVAERKGLEIAGVIQTKESGFRSIDKKEGFNTLTEQLKTLDCHYVICTELSRLARKKIILETIKQYFIDHKIQLWVDDMNFQLFDENGSVDYSTDIVFSVFAAMAESEMKEKKKRMKRGITALNLDGYSVMGKVPFGYKRVLSTVKVQGKYRNQMIVDESAAEQVRAVYNMYLYGIDGDETKSSISQIHQECIARGYKDYLHSRRNVNKALKYHPYTGEEERSEHLRKNADYWAYGDETADKYVKCSSCYRLPQIVPVEIFNAVQEKMKKVSTRIERSSDTEVYIDKSRLHITMLSKMIICPYCKSFYHGEYRYRKERDVFLCVYRCPKHQTHGSTEISMRILDASVWAFCKLRYSKFVDYIKKFPSMLNVDEIQERISNLQAEMAKLQTELEDLAIKYIETKGMDKSGRIKAQYEKDSRTIQDKMAQLDSRMKMEETRLAENANAEAFAASMDKTIEYVEGSKEEMRKYVREIVRCIIPIYRQKHYSVVQIILLKGEMEVLTFNPEEYGAEDQEIRNYLVIDTLDTWEPKIRYISGPCSFDSSGGTFHIAGAIDATIIQAFEDTEDEFFKDLPFIRMDLYSEDGPKRRETPSFDNRPTRSDIGLIGLEKRWGKTYKK